MRFLHTADLHIGKTVNGFSMLEDQRYALDEILRIANEREAEAILVAGDIYDKSMPSAEAVSLVDSFLTKVASAGLKVLGVSGNHDSAERVAYGSELLKAQGVHFSPVYNGAPSSVALEDEHGFITFWLVPFVKPAHIRGYFPEEEIGTDYTKAMAAALSACDIDESQRNILICHQFVTAGSEKPETSDSEISLGGLDNVDASVFDKFDYVALGHIHRAQRIGRDEVRYSGSPLKYSFSEIKHNKSITLVEVNEKGAVSFELLPINPLRDMREIKGPIDAITSEDVAAQQCRTDYLRVVLTDEHPAIDALSRVRRTYPNVMGIEYEYEINRSTALSLTPDVEVEALEPMELFAAFYLEQTGQELTSNQADLSRKAYEHAVEGTKGA